MRTAVVEAVVYAWAIGTALAAAVVVDAGGEEEGL